MKKTVKFKTKKGTAVEVIAELTLKKTVNLDGDRLEVDCCEMNAVKAVVDGYPDQTWFSEEVSPDTFNGELIYGKIGKLALNKTNYKKVKDLVSEMEQHPAWVAKQATIAKNRRDNAELDRRRKENGYCEKCGSYCYGDCTAN